MVIINFPPRDHALLKLVLIGLPGSGRTTYMEQVRRLARTDRLGDLTSIDTEGDRTLFFDVRLPCAGTTIDFQLYTVAGVCTHRQTRQLVLLGAHGVLFVVDSQPERLEAHAEELALVQELLAENDQDPERMLSAGTLFFWNKRDLPEALPEAQLAAALNPWGAPSCEGTTIDGAGVLEALELLGGRVIEKLREDYARGVIAGNDFFPIAPLFRQQG